MWIPLTSQQAIDELIERFGGFHDGCLREVAINTETYVDQGGAMACPGHLDTTAHHSSRPTGLASVTSMTRSRNI